MLYLLDANVLISAHELHYPLKRIPQFWTWLLKLADADTVKLPYEIFNEIAISKGELKDWITAPDHSKKLKLGAHVSPALLQKVISEGYADDLNESELEQIGQDPFLVAYAIPYGPSVTVVTREVSKPSKKRHNRKVPDVCKQFGVNCISDFELFRELDFKIS
jgi:uncharacterized protein DUF4411